MKHYYYCNTKHLDERGTMPIIVRPQDELNQFNNDNNKNQDDNNHDDNNNNNNTTNNKKNNSFQIFFLTIFKLFLAMFFMKLFRYCC